MKEKRIIKGTATEFDIDEYVWCGPVVEFVFKENDKLNRLKMREIKEDLDENPFRGLWIEDGWTLPYSEDEEEELGAEGLRSLGKYVKTLCVSYPNKDKADIRINHEINVIVYENAIQVSLSENNFLRNESKALYSKYHRKIFYGTVVHLVENFTTAEDFIRKVSDLE